MKISESYNGYWYCDKWLYLDEKEFEIPKMTFDEFTRNINLHNYGYEKDWQGNNPFSKSCCDRFWLESKNALVEIYFNDHLEEKSEITITKIITDDTKNSKQLIKDLIDLDKLCDDILKTLTSNLEFIKQKVQE